MTTLQRLTAWYASQCDGKWEHRQGVSIQSCDNPGWWIKIDLKGTRLYSKLFEQVAENVDERGFQLGTSWLSCRVTDGVWHGAGDEKRLEQILSLFLDWAER